MNKRWKVIRSIKGILNICQCKGCHKRYAFETQVKGQKNWTKICSEHANQLCENGKITGFTVEASLDFEERGGEDE